MTPAELRSSMSTLRWSIPRLEETLGCAGYALPRDIANAVRRELA